MEPARFASPIWTCRHRREHQRRGSPRRHARVHGPEQLAGREVSARTIFIRSTILYEILTGKRAFEASTLPELIKCANKHDHQSFDAGSRPRSFDRTRHPSLPRTRTGKASFDGTSGSRCSSRRRSVGGGARCRRNSLAGDGCGVRRNGRHEPAPCRSFARSDNYWLDCIAFRRGSRQAAQPHATGQFPGGSGRSGREIIQQLGYTDAPVDEAYSFQVQSGYLDYFGIMTRRRTDGFRSRTSAPPQLLSGIGKARARMSPERFYSSDGAGVITRTDPKFNVTEWSWSSSTRADTSCTWRWFRHKKIRPPHLRHPPIGRPFRRRRSRRLGLSPC